MGAEQEPYLQLERIFREEAGRLTASLVRLLGDFDLAEEMVSEAVVEALEHWPRDGVHERASSWLLTTARRKGLDRLRRESVYRKKLEPVADLGDRTARELDDRLRLIFICCHPALGQEAQVALTLRAVAGLTTEEIARAFVVPEATLATRIVRAKRKIVSSNVSYRVPGPDELPSRLAEVLTVIYLIFNEGYLSTSGSMPIRRDLARDAEWLGSLLVQMLPGEPEPLGLLALIRLHLARWPARLDTDGRLVLLEHQDRSLWDRRAIAEAISLIERAATLQRPGRYQIEAMIAALHCEAPSWGETDWPRISLLYTLLAEIDPSPWSRSAAPLCGGTRMGRRQLWPMLTSCRRLCRDITCSTPPAPPCYETSMTTPGRPWRIRPPWHSPRTLESEFSSKSGWRMSIVEASRSSERLNKGPFPAGGSLTAESCALRNFDLRSGSELCSQ